MREPEDMGWFAELGTDGEPRAVHGIKRLMPEDAVEISEAQARELSAAVRARQAQQPSNLPNAAPSADLQPIYDQLRAHAQIIQGHAQTLDKHEVTVSAVSQSVANFMQGQKDLAGGKE